jgi:hypothetical protein
MGTNVLLERPRDALYSSVTADRKKPLVPNAANVIAT